MGGATTVLFDLASLTKPMTAVAVALAGPEKNRRLGELLPELSLSQSQGVTLEHLLSHRAGLVAHLPLYEALRQGGSVAFALEAAASARRSDAAGDVPPDGFSPVYSDLGYVLGGVALARHNGSADAGAAISRLVGGPLGLSTTLGTARDLAAAGVDVRGSAAPTEVVAWRGGEVRGEVHDENAWMLTGTGGSGHAGMFGTAAAVLTFACAVEEALSGAGPLAKADLSWLVRDRAGGTLKAGFDGKSAEGSSAGDRFGSRSFGHLGFTGTSFWVDPVAHVVAVLLTNRVHPSRANVRIKEARPLAHDALYDEALRLALR